MRDGLLQLFTKADFHVCGAESHVQAALSTYVGAKPDVAVVDIKLPDGDGIFLTRELKSLLPDVPVCVYSMYRDQGMARDAFRAGARGYVNKSAEGGALLEAVQAVMEGGTFLCKEIASAFTEEWLDAEEGPEQPVLTDREQDVYALLGEGYRTKDIAGQLYISPKTVESYYERLKSKFGIARTPELQRHAIQELRKLD
jgi:DNA-binding NarL/FixJ family response regulator